jgi:signal transduction histidine kinase
MVQPEPSHAHTRMALGARFWGAVTVLVLAGIAYGHVPRPAHILVAALITVVAIAAIFAAFEIKQSPGVVPVVEGVVAALIAARTLDRTDIGLAYLVVPVFIAGLVGGARLMVFTWVSQTAVVTGTLLVVGDVGVEVALRSVSPWLLTAAAAGALSSWVRYTGEKQAPEADAYDAAHRLLSELRTVARRLSAGLDPVGIAQQVLSDVHDVVQDDSSVLLVRSAGGTLLPLATRGRDTTVVDGTDDELVMDCWTSEAPTHESVVYMGRRMARVALPLQLGARMIAVLVVYRATIIDSETTASVMDRLRRHSVQLDTAMVFDEVRSLATNDERRRLAREIHDGIAQEVASLGYYVDSLMADDDADDMRQGLAALREQLTHLVSELRLSIFDLRSEVTPSVTLGAVLADYVHQVGRQSGMTVHLSLNETPNRLRVEVETEILRIAQEAITNARRHSGADHLWVTFSADPPQATLSITDDGDGLGEPRDDSYGMQIMKERADRIGADLAVVSEPRRGTSVALTLISTTTDRRDDAVDAPPLYDDRKDTSDAHIGLAHR